MKRKVNLSLVLSITFLATSIALWDFDNPGWSGNEKSYLGLVAAIILYFLGRRK